MQALTWEAVVFDVFRVGVLLEPKIPGRDSVLVAEHANPIPAVVDHGTAHKRGWRQAFRLAFRPDKSLVGILERYVGKLAIREPLERPELGTTRWRNNCTCNKLIKLTNNSSLNERQQWARCMDFRTRTCKSEKLNCTGEQSTSFFLDSDYYVTPSVLLQMHPRLVSIALLCHDMYLLEKVN